MTIRKSAFETKACEGFNLSKTINAIEVSFASYDINNYAVENSRSYAITGAGTSANIPTFMHPIIIEDTHKLALNNLEKISIVDIRSSGKWDANQAQFIIRNKFEYEFTRKYGNLAHFFINDDARLLLSISTLPVDLYARWISENITRRFGLDPQEQLIIATLAAYFYIGLFTNNKTFEGIEINRVVNIISKSVHVNAEKILDIINSDNSNDLIVIESIDDLCTEIKRITGNIRLNDLNTGILFSILGNTWYGTNAKELIAVALEYPPAWLNIVVAALDDRSYKNTTIAKMTIREKKQDIDLFIKSIAALLSRT